MNKIKTQLLIKSGLYLIVCWLAGLFITAFCAMCYQKFGIIMCIIFGFCSVGAAVCIYSDFCYKAGGKMNTRSNRELVKPNDKHFGAIIGIVPTGINYIFVILLWLSKFGIMKTDFLPWYKTLTIYFLPLTYLFAPPSGYGNDASGKTFAIYPSASELSIGGMIFVTVLPLIFMLACWAAYYIGHEHIDLKEMILYGGKRKK